MAESLQTKHVLADALTSLMLEKPLGSITVGDICSRCSMNRKSFYYHFRDKFDLVIWIFTTDYAAFSASADADADDILRLCRFLECRQSFYRAALRVTGQNSLHDHLAELLRPVLAHRYGLGQEPDQIFLLDLYVRLYQSEIARWVISDCRPSPDRFVRLLYRACAAQGQSTFLSTSQGG